MKEARLALYVYVHAYTESSMYMTCIATEFHSISWLDQYMYTGAADSMLP